MDKNPTPARLWDPFSGEIPFHQQSVRKPGKGMEIPGFIRSFGGILLLLGLITCLAAFIYRDALWLGVPCLCFGLAIIFGADHLNKTDANLDWLLFKLAKQHGWAFELLPTVRADQQATMSSRASSSQGNTHLAANRKVDPRIGKIHERVGDLLTMKIGRITMVDFRAIYRGNSRDALPFWMALGVLKSDMTLAASSLKRDRYGNEGSQAFLFQMLCAYRLDRDTGIRVRLLHEGITGESRTDFQTESVEFNRQFNISIADKSGNPPEDVETQHHALLQALTPATQATLIDLKERYDVQLVIDGDTVFYAGWDKLNTTNFDIIDQHIHTMTEAFADSALSFKHYIE